MISNHYARKHDPKLSIHEKDSKCTKHFDESNPMAKQIIDDFLNNKSKVLNDVHPECATPSRAFEETVIFPFLFELFFI